MATDRVQTGLRFTEDMLLKISYISKKNYRSLNAQMEFLAQECIEKYEREYGEIQIPEEEKYQYRK